MPTPRKPAIVKIAEGNPGNRPIPKEINGRGHPDVPPELSTEEGELWVSIYESLPIGLLTAADTAVMERMAIAWARYRQCQRTIRAGRLMVLLPDSRGVDRLVRNPLLAVQRQAADEMHACGEVLGLSPVARTRITTEGKEDEDPLTLLLDGRRDGAYYTPKKPANTANDDE